MTTKTTPGTVKNTAAPSKKALAVKSGLKAGLLRGILPNHNRVLLAG